MQTFLNETKGLVQDPKLSKGIRTTTYSAKTGILLLSLVQSRYRTADQALKHIEQAETYLKTSGLDSRGLSLALRPLSLTSSFIQTGVSKGLEWSIGSVSFAEYITGLGVSSLSSLVTTSIQSISVPSLPSVSISLPSVPTFPSITNPFSSFGSGKAKSCKGFLGARP